MRCFVALGLPIKIRNEIKKIQILIKKKNFMDGKFTKLKNLHLTLKFLGEINEEKIKKVKEKLRNIKLRKFNAEIGEIGVFSEKFIKIIWVKLNGERVFELQKIIDENLKKLFEIENRFMSHITIARPKNLKMKNELINYLKQIKIKTLEFEVRYFSLFKSTLTSKGAVYSEIQRYKLL